MASEEAKRFDLQGYLAGRTFPESTVPVMVDEKLQVAYARLCYEHDREFDAKKQKELKKARDKMLESFKDITLKVTVRQIPQHVVDNIVDEIKEEFPSKTNMLGQEIDSREALDEFNTRLWAAHLVRLEAADGSFSVPTVDEVRELKEGLPEASLLAIKNEIDKLSEDAKSGYETSVTELGFLSTP